MYANKINNLDTLNEAWIKVREFHRTIDAPTPDIPESLDKARASQRAGFMREEIDEFLDAGNLTEQVDAVIDLLYLCFVTLVEMGVPPQKVFSIVHSANMAKTDVKGGPQFSESGKLLKPVNWVSPEKEISKSLDELVILNGDFL